MHAQKAQVWALRVIREGVMIKVLVGCMIAREGW
jgi:hypothetical protein